MTRTRPTPPLRSSSRPPLRSLLFTISLAGVVLGATLMGAARATEKFVFMTNWYAEAEHGGFYQAVATGIYRKYDLDVDIRMGGAQVNITQLMAAGQADCIIGASDLQVVVARANGVPLVTVAAMFQKDPDALIAHDDVKSLADMKGKTILIAASSYQNFWPWLKAKYGFTDAQARPYTFNVQPFVADHSLVQQGYITSEPYALEKAGVKANAFLLSDFGYPPYSTTIVCMENTVRSRHAALAAFVRGSVEGWKSYLANPGPGNALIKKDNPSMSDDQLDFSVRKIRETGLVTSGDAERLGIGIITDARIKASFDFLVGARLVDPAKVELSRTYTTEFVRDLKIFP